MKTSRAPLVLMGLSLLAAAAGCSRDSKGTPNAVAAEGDLTPGGAAPDFTAKAHDGTELHLAALKGKPVVLYFYPKDETPGCTKQACALRDAWADLEKTGVVLVGVSGDSDESHKAFAAHHKLPFRLISDPDGKLAAQFKVPFRAGFASRQTIVIDKEGRIKKVYRSVDVTTHAKDVLGDLSS